MIKKFSIEFIDDNGKLNINSKNDGFNAFEIIGFFKWKIDDIERQILGEIKPETVKRERVID